MKQIGYILLTLLLVLQAGGLLVWYEVKQGVVRYQQHRRSMKADAPRQLLVLTAEAYQKARVRKRDVKVDGKMYDVVSVVRQGGHVYVTAVRDHKEERVLHRIATIAGHTQDGSSMLPDGLLRLLSIVYVLPPPIHTVTFFTAVSTVYFESPSSLKGRMVDVGLRPPAFSVEV